MAVGPEDVLDAYIYGDPAFYEAEPAGSAELVDDRPSSRTSHLRPDSAAQQREC